MTIMKQMSDFADKELKITVIKMFPKLMRIVNEQSENFNRKKKKKYILNWSHRAEECNN